MNHSFICPCELMTFFLLCCSGCLRSCMKTMETLCHCSTGALSSCTGSRLTARLHPGHSTPKISCKRCHGTTAMLSQVCSTLVPSFYPKQNLPLVMFQVSIEMGSTCACMYSLHSCEVWRKRHSIITYKQTFLPLLEQNIGQMWIGSQNVLWESLVTSENHSR